MRGEMQRRMQGKMQGRIKRVMQRMQRMITLVLLILLAYVIPGSVFADVKIDSITSTGSECSVNINGKCYQVPDGVAFSVGEGGVYVDGKLVDQESLKNIKVITVNITGNVKSITNARSVAVKGDVWDVHTSNGDVEVSGSIKGSVQTVNGSIHVQSIGGNVSTINGNVSKEFR